MLRRLATFVLLVPLSLNGLWMVCAEAPVEAANVPPSGKTGEQCKKMCPLHAAPQDQSARMDTASTGSAMQPGSICLISSNGKGTAITAFAFAVTTPAAAVTVATDPGTGEVVPEILVSYADPPLPGFTPPPKA
jgi:hypothetical protein